MKLSCGFAIALFISCWCLTPCGATAAGAAETAAGGSPREDTPAARNQQRSITDRSLDWPSWPQWQRVLLLRDYNTRIVVFGSAALGLAAGLIGSFTLLRKRALMGDALSHSTLPGIGLAFLIGTSMGWSGKSLTLLHLGAAISGLLGVAAILAIRNLTRLKEDAALGIVLSVFFGAGVALLSIAQQQSTGHAAGLESFIYGKTASMVARDAWLIGGTALLCIAASALWFKEFKILCFDEVFAGSRGFPAVWLDVLLMALVVIVTIIGLQAVGLILMIALLVIPAAAARFWTEEMTTMAFVAALIGAVSCMIGSALSAVAPRLPSGAMIVLSSAFFFLLSMIAGRARGLVVRSIRRVRFNRRVNRDHLLRGAYELLEFRGQAGRPFKDAAPTVRFDELLAMRSWSRRALYRQVRRSERFGLVQRLSGELVRLTAAGLRLAERLVHEHRLWEIYLITYADIAPSKVDRDADAIEHVLGPELIAELTQLLKQRTASEGVAESPHKIDLSAPGSPGQADRR